MTTTGSRATRPHRTASGARGALLILGLGIVAGLVALVVTIVYVFQPWRSCSYDDTPAACAMLPGDAAVMMTAMATMPVAAIVTVVGAVLLWRAMHAPRG